MRTLYTLAYPELTAEASAFVDRLRAAHDPQHGIVAAHFTLLFACSAVDEVPYTEHVQEVARSAAPIAFDCRRSMSGTDGTATRVYLVPDQGFDAIAQLHDALYGGIMAAQRRHDIAYLPHITVAAKPRRGDAEALCERLNRGGLQIAGQLRRLTVGTLQDGMFKDLSQHALG